MKTKRAARKQLFSRIEELWQRIANLAEGVAYLGSQQPHDSNHNDRDQGLDHLQQCQVIHSNKVKDAAWTQLCLAFSLKKAENHSANASEANVRKQ